MNINKFSKLKDGQYKIVFEDGTFIVVHEDLILKYELLIKKYMENDLKEKILSENLNYIACFRAIKYISIRMRSVLEIKEYLSKLGVSSNIILECIELLKSRGYLDDKSYAKSFVSDRVHLSIDGPFKIARELSNKGVDEDIINEAILVFSPDIQVEKCEKIALKMISINRKKSAIMLKRKITQYLSNLGYENSIINSVIAKLKIVNDNGDIFKKEYDKIYKKLSRKYEGKELQYRIKQKMYALGFENIE